MLAGYTYQSKVWFYASSNGTSWDISTNSGVVMGDVRLNEWVHRAVVRQGSNFYLFENGKLINSLSSSSSIYNPGNVYLGRYYDSSKHFWKGYIKNFRISDVVRWTNNFTPPTRPYGEPWKNIKSIYIKNKTPSGYTRLEYLKSDGN